MMMMAICNEPLTETVKWGIVAGAITMSLLLGGITCEVRAASAASELADSIYARSRAVFSGEMRYHLETGFRDKSKVILSRNYEYVFRGPSWLRIGETGTVFLSDNNAHLQYRQDEQPDGQIDHTVKVYHASPPDQTFPFPPYFAGTFWFSEQCNFVKAQRERGKTVSGTEINGVTTEAIEWKVAKEEIGNAFVMYNDALKNGGALRVYTAPQMGYVLPRVECIAADGKVAIRYNARDFEDVGSGVYLPRHFSRTTLRRDGTEGFFVEYAITSFASINGAVSDDAFMLDLPHGTQLADLRTEGAPTVVEIGSRTPLAPDIRKLVKTDAGEGLGWKWRVALTGVGFALIVACLVFAFRHMRRRDALG